MQKDAGAEFPVSLAPDRVTVRVKSGQPRIDWGIKHYAREGAYRRRALEDDLDVAGVGPGVGQKDAGIVLDLIVAHDKRVHASEKVYDAAHAIV